MPTSKRSSQRPKTFKHAVALEYSELDNLPSVVATGRDNLAEQIVNFAKQHNIPVREDAALTEMLKELSVGSAISPQTFKIVAEVITFLYALDKEWREAHPFVGEVVK